MEFVFVSGDLALDLLGTLKWRRDTREELLDTPVDAAEWAVAAGILTAPPDFTDDELRQLVELREAVYRLVWATMTEQPWPDRDVELLNGLANGPGARLTLAADGLRRDGDAGTVHAAVARAAADVLDRAGELRLRECDRERCTRIFIDRSRTGNRRWCGMAECGNRIKAAHYRARKATAAS